jgi:hypothetical protein
MHMVASASEPPPPAFHIPSQPPLPHASLPCHTQTCSLLPYYELSTCPGRNANASYPDIFIADGGAWHAKFEGKNLQGYMEEVAEFAKQIKWTMAQARKVT